MMSDVVSESVLRTSTKQQPRKVDESEKGGEEGRLEEKQFAGNDSDNDSSSIEMSDGEDDDNVWTNWNPRLKKKQSNVDAVAKDDPFNLQRFVKKHRSYFDTAVREIDQGEKRSCWSWYIFPVQPWVVNGVERGSWTNQMYALRDLKPNNLRGEDAARAYLKLKPSQDGVNLRNNYLRIMTAVYKQLKKGVRSIDLVGFLDDPKMKSSLRLFEKVSRNDVDEEINDICRKTLKIMGEKLLD